MKSESVSRSVMSDFVIPETSLLGSSVPGILQAKLLDCIAIFFSRGSSQGLNPGLPALQADSLLGG